MTEATQQQQQQSRGEDFILLMQEAWVQSLVGELRFRLLPRAAKYIKLMINQSRIY